MARIVLVHGIGQTQQSADTLEKEWLPALAGGLRVAGHPDLADQITNRATPNGIETRMAFYGNIFLHPDAQGPTHDISPAVEDLATIYAGALLENAARQAPDPRDRDDASRALRDLAEQTNPQPEAQGHGQHLRRPLTALSKLRWFGPMAVKFGGHTISRSLLESLRYLTEPDLRTTAQNQVLHLIDDNTRLIIGHSLGSVVAYEALHQLPADRPPLHLITLGSPLGMRGVFYEKLHPQPPHVPAALTSWHNYASPDDLVALTLDLAPLYPAAASQNIQPITKGNLDTGAQPHSANHYLTKRSVGAAVAAAFS